MEQSTASWMAHLTLIAGVVSLTWLLIPARLLHVSILRRYRTQHLWVARQGKWLGLAVIGWAIAHAFTMLPVWQWSPAAALLCLIVGIGVVLAAISNKWSYAHIRYWKHLNMLVWLFVPWMVVYCLLSRERFDEVFSGLCVLLLGLCAVAGIAGLYEPKPGYFARHRVWLMAVGTVVAALVWAFWPA